jgi:nitrate/TMAO reductase-like tetraheme cytochrome c subunit
MRFGFFKKTLFRIVQSHHIKPRRQTLHPSFGFLPELDAPCVNLIVTVAAQHDQVLKIIRTPLCVSRHMMQFKYSRVRHTPHRHIPSTVLACTAVAFVNGALNIRWDMPVMRLCNTFNRE